MRSAQKYRKLGDERLTKPLRGLPAAMNNIILVPAEQMRDRQGFWQKVHGDYDLRIERIEREAKEIDNQTATFDSCLNN